MKTNALVLLLIKQSFALNVSLSLYVV